MKNIKIYGREITIISQDDTGIISSMLIVYNNQILSNSIFQVSFFYSDRAKVEQYLVNEGFIDILPNHAMKLSDIT